jgi:hypothetical protein
LAGTLGFEPRNTDLESVSLPIKPMPLCKKIFFIKFLKNKV